MSEKSTSGIERLSNQCHICDTRLVWLDEADKSVCPECNPEVVERYVDTGTDGNGGDS